MNHADPTSVLSGAVPNEFFAYFSAIEERFNARRGSVLLLSTLDWALIETWREAGIPLQAVLRGIERSFDRYDARTVRARAGRSRLQKVNGLAWCAQAVMEAATELVDASTGLPLPSARATGNSDFETDRLAAYLRRNAILLQQAAETANSRKQSEEVRQSLAATGNHLMELAAEVERPEARRLEDLDRALTLLEEQQMTVLRQAVPQPELLALHEAADRELGSARARLGAEQSRRVREQFVQKRLRERFGLPRLSLFYIGAGE